jgi:deazaflavin-dependent oxidoreductase (nitroreductase family)
MPNLDRVALRLTGRRHTLTAIMTGLPVVVLTTTGSRTGKRRTVSVLGFSIAEGLAVVAGNFGRSWDPAWCVNLRSDARATIEQGNMSRAVIAHELVGEQRDSAWRQCLSFYPAGAAYAERAAPRVIAVFLLDPDA